MTYFDVYVCCDHCQYPEPDKGKNFRECRKKHYDEFQRVKEFRQKGSFLEDEDDKNSDKMEGESKDSSPSASTCNAINTGNGKST